MPLLHAPAPVSSLICSHDIYLSVIQGVVGVNAALVAVFHHFVRFERHNSRTAELASVTVKLFVMQVINTAILTLSVNANLRDFDVRMPDAIPIFSGSFTDFHPAWFVSVGTALMLTMLLNMVVPNITPFIKEGLRKLRICWDRSGRWWDPTRSKRITQHDLEELLTGGQFLMPQRYSAAMNTIFTTLFYCSGLPLLLPLGTVALTLQVHGAWGHRGGTGTAQRT